MNMNTLIINPQLSLKPDAQKRFEKILQTLDFSICTNDYDVAKLMFKRLDDSLFTMGKDLVKANKEIEELKEKTKGIELPAKTPAKVEVDPAQLSLC